MQKRKVLSLERKSEGVMVDEWWVDGTDGRSATKKAGWGRVGEISAGLTERSRKLIPETEGKHIGRNDLLFLDVPVALILMDFR